MPWLIQKVQQGQAVETDPEVMWLTGQTEGQEGGIYQQLEYARQMKDKRCQILVPVHSVGLSGGEHWSLLCLSRPPSKGEPQPFTCLYYDSLAEPTEAAVQAVSLSIDLFTRLLQPVPVNSPAAPGRPQSNCYRQSDGWSCGYWTLRHAEMVYRLHRGEGYRVLSTDLPLMRERWNNWLLSLIRHLGKRQKQEESADQKAAKKQKVTEAVAAAVASASSSKSLPEAPLPANAVQQDDLNHGCSKCRWSLRGCLACCPTKAAKYFSGKRQVQPSELPAKPVEPGGLAAQSASAKKADKAEAQPSELPAKPVEPGGLAAKWAEAP